MRTMTAVPVVFAGVLATSLMAVAQDQALPLTLEQQLTAQYRPTRVGANGVVLQAGSVFTVQLDGIKANPAANQVYWCNSFKDGRVRQPAICVRAGIGKVAVADLRFLQVGEKVYVTKMEIKDAAVILDLQTCGACNPSSPDPNDVPYRAELSVQFHKGYVEPANGPRILDAIGQVLSAGPAGAKAETSQAAPPAPPAASEPVIEPIPPPPPPAEEPAGPPKTIAKGDTTQQVLAAFGQPQKIVKLDAKEIYYYKDLKVTFVKGQVSDVE